ncbi:MAG: hypothetical protein KJO07_05615 [Deltaproteobacteria bacterium]|jgi:hypothetical protein|nr:hypothetical protein [Deltaproteobacteria bacterium]
MTARTAFIAVALSFALATPAAAKGFKAIKTSRSKTSKAKVQRNRVKPAAKPKPRIGARLSAKLFGKRGPKPTGRALEAKLSHPYAPTVQGQTRVWKINSGGKTSKMTETVKRTEASGKNLKAEVHYSNGTAKWTAVTQTYRGEVMVSQMAKLGDKPAKGVTVYGVAMPRKLRVGKSWSNIVTHEDGSHSRQTEYKVVKAIRMKDPNGVMRNGFEVAIKDSSRVRVDGKIASEVKSTGTYRVLSGVGTVYTSHTVNGVTVENTLVGMQ